MRFARHLFVCTQERDGGGKPACGARGGRAILAAVERGLALAPDARASATGCACLGPCFDGPNAVVYPDGVWYEGVSLDDVPALLAHLTTGAIDPRRRDDDDA